VVAFGPFDPRSSLHAERNGRFDACRSQGRPVARHQTQRNQYRGCGRERHRLIGRDPEEQRLRMTAGAQRDEESWNDAAVATTETMRAAYGDFLLEWPGRYAAAVEVNWTNQK